MSDIKDNLRRLVLSLSEDEVHPVKRIDKVHQKCDCKI